MSEPKKTRRGKRGGRRGRGGGLDRRINEMAQERIAARAAGERLRVARLDYELNGDGRRGEKDVGQNEGLWGEKCQRKTRRSR